MPNRSEALLAASELMMGVDGKKFLTALTAGYEGGIRIGASVGLGPLKQGWHIAGFNGPFASALSASKILGLDAELTAQALGIGGTQGSGLMSAQFGADTKRYHMGRAAQSGLIGALLALRHFTGVPTILEEKYGGYCSTIAPGYFALDRITYQLGQEYLLLEKESLKCYPMIFLTYPAVEAAEFLVLKYQIAPDQIDKIKIGVNQVTKNHVGDPYVAPRGVAFAQSSIAYGVAVMVLEKKLTIDQLSKEKIKDPKMLEMARKIEIIVDPEIEKSAPDQFAARVEFRLKNGKLFSHYIPFPKGSPQRGGMPQKEVIKKFQELTQAVISPDQADQIVEKIEHLEKVNDVALEFTPLLAGCVC